MSEISTEATPVYLEKAKLKVPRRGFALGYTENAVLSTETTLFTGRELVVGYFTTLKISHKLTRVFISKRFIQGKYAPYFVRGKDNSIKLLIIEQVVVVNALEIECQQAELFFDEAPNGYRTHFNPFMCRPDAAYCPWENLTLFMCPLTRKVYVGEIYAMPSVHMWACECITNFGTTYLVSHDPNRLAAFVGQIKTQSEFLNSNSRHVPRPSSPHLIWTVTLMSIRVMRKMNAFRQKLFIVEAGSYVDTIEIDKSRNVLYPRDLRDDDIIRQCEPWNEAKITATKTESANPSSSTDLANQTPSDKEDQPRGSASTQDSKDLHYHGFRERYSPRSNQESHIKSRTSNVYFVEVPEKTVETSAVATQSTTTFQGAEGCAPASAGKAIHIPPTNTDSDSEEFMYVARKPVANFDEPEPIVDPLLFLQGWRLVDFWPATPNCA